MQKSPFFLFTLLAYSLALHTLFAESSCDAQGNEICSLKSRVYRLSVSHREGGGIGYNQGYTSLDAFFSLPSKWDMVPFFDFRAHVFNDGKWAANAGLGIRKQLSDSPWILGGNAFYDYRHIAHTTFNQIGFGLELLGTKWDFHGNAYIPVGHNRRNYANPFRGFEGHSAFFTGKYECAFAGADVLAGRELWSCDDYLIRGALGAYFLKGHFNKKAGGGLFKITAEITRYVHLEGQLSYDNIFKWRPQGELKINIPLGKKSRVNRCNLTCNSQKTLSRWLNSPIDRFEMIVKKNIKKKRIALDPISKQPLNFIFVDNLRGHSDGSFENPFATLLEAQNGSQINDVIYVFPGDGTANGMNMGITLQQGQSFIGSSANFPVSIKGAGSIAIPAQTTIFPLITNVGGNTVTLASGNTVSGFMIESAQNGIEGGSMMIGSPGINNATITNNQFNNVNLTSILLQNITGVIHISQNLINKSFGIGLNTATTGTSTIFVDNNILNTEPSSIISFNAIANGIHQSLISLQNNTITGAETGIQLDLNDNTITQIVISKNNLFNSITSSLSSGMEVISGNFAQGFISIVDNTITVMQNEGIEIVTADDSVLNIDMQRNLLTQVNLSGGDEGVFFSNSNQITLKMVDNSSFPSFNAPGYLLKNVAGQFSVQSPDLSLTGVELLNVGTVVPQGTLSFIPLTP